MKPYTLPSDTLELNRIARTQADLLNALLDSTARQLALQMSLPTRDGWAFAWVCVAIGTLAGCWMYAGWAADGGVL